MLVSMTVRNIALIEKLDIDFHRGLHVLTGETGAGKSIFVDSINLVLGERADRGLIRTGCEKASVEAIIDITDCPGVQALLHEQSLEAESNQMSIHREITLNDRNICRVCGVIVPLTFLRQISELLVDVHGQHEHQSLLDVKNHLGFLDSFGDDAFSAQAERVANTFHVWKESSVKFSALRKENAQREQRMEYVSARVKELEAAQLTVGESESLSQERARFASAEKIDSALQTAYHAVLSGEGAQQSAMLKLRSASDALAGIAELDPRFSTLAERLSSAYYEAEELGIELRELLTEQNFDPERSEMVLERLDLLRRLERRHNMTADELVDHFELLKDEMRNLESMDDRLKRAEADYKAKLLEYRREAGVLTENRQSRAKHFEMQMEAQLKDLGMSSTHFVCVFSKPEEEQKRQVPTVHGDDHVQFFIAPNPGEPLKPLYKTASGGELSRLMLAMKAAAASRNTIPCMIFDEIDTGISGQIASVVADKMASIAKYHQVLCVTHLAQIAAVADTQYKVEKHIEDGRTVTTVRELTDGERVEEVARLVGSMDLHAESGLNHARNMLSSARERKAGKETEG